MESEGRGGRILRWNFARFSFQKYLRADGWWVLWLAQRATKSDTSGQCRVAAARATRKGLTRVGVTQTSSGSPSLAVARVTRRGPLSLRMTCRGQSHSPRPESIAGARRHSPLPESFSITDSPRLESHAVDRVIRPGPLPESLAAAHCLTVTLAPRLESESFAQPRVTRQGPSHSPGQPSLAAGSLTRLDQTHSQRHAVTRRGPSHSPRPAVIQADLPRPKSLAASTVNCSCTNSYMNLYKNYTYELDVYHFIHKVMFFQIWIYIWIHIFDYSNMNWSHMNSCIISYVSLCRAEVRRSFITTTVRESQVTPHGRHR